jgi:hypothetical protein
MSSIELTHFSDVLRVRAYLSQARMNAISDKFGDSVRIERDSALSSLTQRKKIESM